MTDALPKPDGLKPAGLKPNGPTPKHGELFQAVWKDDLVLAEELLKRGSSPDEMHGVFSVLTRACGIGGHDPRMTQLLLKYHADIDLPDPRGNTPLHTAVFYANIEMVRFLIDAGADLGKLSGDGETALDMAMDANIGHQEIVKMLREAQELRARAAEGKAAALAAEKERERQTATATKLENVKEQAAKKPKLKIAP